MENKDLEIHKSKYQAVFLAEGNGKYILDDLKTIFCVHSDILTDNDAYKEGLRMAYRYIESNLSIKKQ
jgi:hypothetical protein